jgi:hypothetical protein
LPGASFVVNSAAQAHDSALTTAAAEMKWLNGWSATATFEGEFSGLTRSYAGKGVVRYGRRIAVGKNKKRLRRSHFTRFFRQVICPSGSCREFLSSPQRKNKSLRDLLKSDL